MRSISVSFKAGLFAAVWFALPVPRACGAGWKYGSSVNYDTGKYGTDVRASSVYIPFTLKRYYPEGDISVTLPFLRQSSAGQITRVGGKSVRVAKGSRASGTSSEAGIGDILVRGSYIIKKEGRRSYDLAAAGCLKLPAANENKGLGTGELDEGVGLEFGKELSRGLTLLVDGYYTLIGDPDGVDFNNELSLDIGVLRKLNKQLALTLLYATRSALVDGNDDARELRGTLDYTAPDGNHYSGGLLLGLSAGSPQYGLSAGFSRRF